MVLLTLLSLFSISYSVWGEPFVQLLYFEKTEFLKGIIVGQAMHPLDYYYQIADGLFLKAVGLGLIPIVIVGGLIILNSWLSFHRFDTGQRQRLVNVIAVFPFVFIGTLIALRLFFNTGYSKIVVSEGILEHLQAGFYFASSVTAFAYSLNLFGRDQKIEATLYVIVSLALFFVCLEEISWGQHYFQFDSPAMLLTQNRQGEVNIHNLSAVHPLLPWAYIWVGFFGSSLHALLSPAFKSKHKKFVDLFVPPPLLMFYFLPVFYLNVYHMVFRPFGFPGLPEKRKSENSFYPWDF
jgi:hypothetical protein